MALTDLVPWTRGRGNAPQRLPDDPFLALHREMNRMFDDVARGFGLGPTATGSGAAGLWPHVDIHETDRALKVIAELPGLTEKDVELSLNDGVLTLKGEKKSERDGALYSERWHGQFRRSFQLGPDVDPGEVEAVFKDGVLTVTLGKRPDSERQVRRIPISAR